MQIDRCYCYDETFEDLKAVADAEEVASVEALQEHVTFGENCQLCHPYVRRMLDTGQTVFHDVVTPDESASP